MKKVIIILFAFVLIKIDPVFCAAITERQRWAKLSVAQKNKEIEQAKEEESQEAKATAAKFEELKPEQKQKQEIVTPVASSNKIYLTPLQEESFQAIEKTKVLPSGLPRIIASYTEKSLEEIKKNQELLFNAVRAGNLQRAKDLLKSGVYVDATDTIGNTALIIASKTGDKHMVNLLLENGANVNSSNAYKDTALIEAAKGGFKEIVEILLNKGANVNAVATIGNTALMEAAKNNQKEIVKILLKHKADVNIEDIFNYNALIIAYAHNAKDVVNILTKISKKQVSDYFD